jgi:glycine/D-amino acid oxidase-like deaminating enzyme
MKRDGTTISLWQHDIPSYLSTVHDLPAQAEIVIVGGGITGLSTSLKLQLSGKSCVLIEAREIGFGTTGGTTCHLNTMVDTPYYRIKNDFGEDNARKVVKLTSEAISMAEHYVQEFAIDCGFARKKAFLYSQDKEQSKELEKIVISAMDAGVSIQYSTTTPIPVPFDGAAEAENQAQMHPAQYLFAIAQQFEKAGGIIIQNCRVKEVATENKQTIVNTSRGKISAGIVVYATHIPPGVNILHFRCVPYRSMQWLSP